MIMKKLALSTAITSALLLTACGGGGSSSTQLAPVTKTSLSGVAAKGVIQGGEVTAYELTSSGWVARGTATTNAKGEYQLSMTDYAGGVVKLEIKAGNTSTMKCDLTACGDKKFGESVALSSDFALEAVLPPVTSSQLANIPITPYTSLAAAYVDAQLEANKPVSTATITQTLSQISTLVGFDVAATQVKDITDASQMATATVDEQRAAALGASVLALSSSDKPLATVLNQLTRSFADDRGFDSGDEVTITQLTTAWEQVLSDSAVTNMLSQEAEAAVAAQQQLVESKIDEQGGYTPQPDPSLGKSAVEKGKAVVGDTRSFIYNLINKAKEGSYDQPLEALGVNVDAAAEVFDRDTAAMSEILGLGIEQTLTTLTNDSELQAELKANNTVKREVTITSGANTLGKLTLQADNYNGVKLHLFGTLKGSESGAREVTVDVNVDSTLDLAQLIDNGSKQTALALALQGSVGDGSTSLTISKGTLSASLSAPLVNDNLQQVMTGLKLQDLTLKIVSDGASFAGVAGFELIKVTGPVSEYFYDGAPHLTLKQVALSGAFVTKQQESMSASLALDLLNADTFDLLAFLNGQNEFYFDLDGVVPADKVAALKAASKVANVASNWTLYYSQYSYVDDSGAVQSGQYASSYDWTNNGNNGGQESYAALTAIYDPATTLREQFASISGAVVDNTYVSVSDYNNMIWGKVTLPEYDETDSNFLKANLTASLELKNVEGLPNAKVWANVERNKLNGGNANLLVSWDGAAYTFRMSDVDVKAKSGALSVTNAYGVTVDFTSVNLSDGAVAGAVYVEGTKVGDITTLDNGLIKVKFTDGSFETLQ